MWLEHSAKVTAICKQNYKSNCGNCPLRPECVKRYPSTREGINTNIQAINELAEKILSLSQNHSGSLIQTREEEK